ncbi:MAG: PAS domain S-box protein [Polyangiaceae bacterium]
MAGVEEQPNASQPPAASLLDTIFDQAGAGLCLLDPRGHVMMANDAWLVTAGRRLNDVLGREIFELFPQATAEARQKHVDARRGEQQYLPPRAVLLDGRRRWFEGRISPVPMEGGTGLLLTVLDITEQKRTEEELRGAEELYRSLLDHMVEGCQVIDFDWRYLYVNEAVCAQSGLRPDQMVGKTVLELYPGVEASPLFATLDGVMRSRVPAHFETEFSFPDGRVRWFDLSVQPQPRGIFILSVDVTERRDREEAQRLALGEVKAIVDAAPMPIMAMDASSKMVLWSAAATRVFGWTADEVLGQPLMLLPIEREAELVALRRAVAGGEIVRDLVTERSARDGRLVPVRLSVGPLKREDGTLRGMVAAMTDLTAERQLEDALAESTRRFATVFEESPIAKLLVRAADSRIVEVNEAALRLFDRTREATLGATTASLPFGPPEVRAAFKVELAMGGEITDLFDVPVYLPSGEIRNTLVSSRSMTLSGEVYVLVVLQDITARKHVEEALKDSEGRFRQLADTIEEAFWLTDPGKREMVYVSPGYERIWGRPVGELRDNPQAWLEAIHAEDRARVIAALPKQTLGTYDEEYRVVRPDGVVRWVRDRGFPVRDAAGRVVRVAGSAQDVTERRELEAQLRQTQKMESVGVLAGGVAHDFNNLLTVIHGCCELLGDEVAPSSVGGTLVREIREAGERAAALTRQLLAFSRREVVEPRVLELNAVILETEKMLRRVLGEDIDLAIALDAGTVRVKSDAGGLTQVLMNLAVNARDAMPRGGRLTISTRRARDGECRRPCAGGCVVISVSDTGSGITPDVQAHLFEPFFTTKGVGRGTGLGLSVVHGIVSGSGGHVEVSSEPGAGATFRVYLPIVEEAVEARRAPQAHGGERASATVLLVEDELPIRRIAARALLAAGYTVLQACDGVEGLELARRHQGPIHALVTDVVMPRMDGRSLAQALASTHPHIRVLYTSGYPDDAVVRYGVEHQAVSLLSKPYSMSDLRSAVHELLATPAPPTETI